VELVALAVAILWVGITTALVLAIGKGTGDARPRVRALAAAVAVLTALNIVITNFSSIYYTRPLWLTALLVMGWVGLFALIILLTRTIRPYRGKVFLLGSLLLATLICAGIVLIVWPFGTPTGLFLTRAEQIADASGFTAIVPAGEDLDVIAGLPVDSLPAPEEGLSMNYERFVLQERKADAPMSEADLLAIVAPGETPLGGATVPDDAEISVVSVNGRTAVAATFDPAPEASSKPGFAGEPVVILVLEMDGVDVRLESAFGEAMTIDELVQTAETLAPRS